MLMRKTQFKEIEVVGEEVIDDKGKGKDPRRVMGLAYRWRDLNQREILSVRKHGIFGSCC